MKKILLTISAIVAISVANAQTVVWSDNFNDLNISDWTLVDADGDGRNWSAVQITDAFGLPSGTPQLRSASWQTVPLTPDNWAITPAIDLSAYPVGSTIALNWLVKASDADYDAENYTVYVGTQNTPTSLLTSTTTFSEITLNGVNTLSPRTLDISAFAGNATVYVAFRHYNVSDQFTMEIDDVAVVATALGVDAFFKSNFAMYPNPAKNVLNISGNAGLSMENVVITDLNGRVVKQQNLGGVSASEINVADLTSGMYLITISSAEGQGTSKFMKN